MGDQRRQDRSQAGRGTCPEETPAECRKKDEPRQKRGRQTPPETGKQVVGWQGGARGEEEGRVGECQAAAHEIMGCPANGGLMPDRRRLGDVPVGELPVDGMQQPSTDGPVASSARPSREPAPFHHYFGQVHQAGTPGVRPQRLSNRVPSPSLSRS
jgi:hypothetical protein